MRGDLDRGATLNRSSLHVHVFKYSRSLEEDTSLNRSSLGVLLVMGGGLDTGTTLHRSSLGVLFVMRGDLDRGATLNRSSLHVHVLPVMRGGLDIEEVYMQALH